MRPPASTGLIKAALAVERGLLPPSLHFREPEPRPRPRGEPLPGQRPPAEWRPDGRTAPRGGQLLRHRRHQRSRGPGGSATVARAGLRPSRRHAWQLLVLSARTPAALEAASSPPAPPSLSREPRDASLAGCRRGPSRSAAARSSTGAMLLCAGVHGRDRALRELSPRSGRVLTRRQEAARARVVFLFPGQGAQHPGRWGSGALPRRTRSSGMRWTRAAERLLRARLGLDLLELLLSRGGAARGGGSRAATDALRPAGPVRGASTPWRACG